MNNYHTHTMRCHHAFGTEEEYIQAAIDSGIKELGFSDHSPWHYHSSFCSHIRMKEEELDDYVNTLRELKEKYKSDISIKIGLEAEYFPQYMEWLKETVHRYELDYLILGNHYDDSDEYGIYFGGPLNQNQLTKYVDNCIKAIESGLYSYIAHPDLAYYPTDDPFYYKEMKRLCVAAKEYHMPLEYNLLGYSEHRQYPNDVFFCIAKEVGNQVIIGMDAHDISSILDKETLERAQKYLKDLGVEVVDHIRFLR